MKVILSLFVVFAVFNAQAEELLGLCTGDHHGTYLDIVSVEGKVVLKTSTDGEGAPLQYSITEFRNEDRKVAAEDQVKKVSDAIRENVILVNGGTSPAEVGQLIVKAKRGRKTLLLNINKSNGQNFLVQDGTYVEEIVCRVPDSY